MTADFPQGSLGERLNAASGGPYEFDFLPHRARRRRARERRVYLEWAGAAVIGACTAGWLATQQMREARGWIVRQRLIEQELAALAPRLAAMRHSADASKVPLELPAPSVAQIVPVLFSVLARATSSGVRVQHIEVGAQNAALGTAQVEARADDPSRASGWVQRLRLAPEVVELALESIQRIAPPAHAHPPSSGRHAPAGRAVRPLVANGAAGRSPPIDERPAYAAYVVRVVLTLRGSQSSTNAVA